MESQKTGEAERSSHAANQEATQKRPVVYNANLQPISGKNPYKNRAGELVKRQVGLFYESWLLVPPEIKDDLWNQLSVRMDLGSLT